MTIVRRQSVCVILVFLFACGPVWTQSQAARPQDYVPPEMQPSDPQVKAYLDAGEKLAKDGNYFDAFQQLQKALDYCSKNRFTSDQALIESSLGVAYFRLGKLDDAKRYWLSSFADAGKTGNLVVQTNSLVALSSLAQSMGNLNEARDLGMQATNLARKSKNLWILSRALGEFGRLQLAMGKLTEARSSIEEALRLDRLNQYSWEPSHLLYVAWATATDESRMEQTMHLATSARELAVKYEDYLVYMQASTTLAQGYAHKGQIKEAIALLEHAREGVTDDGKPVFARSQQYRAVMSLPYFKVSFLEAMALAYQRGQRADDAIKTWSELFDAARASGFPLAAGEAAQGIADLYQAKKDFAKAASYYVLAAENWAIAGDAGRRIAALSSEAFMLSQLGEADKAIHVYQEVLPLVKAANNPSRQFLIDLSIAEIAQPKGDLEQTDTALREAESLLSPDLTLVGVEPRFVFALYLHLADLHAKRNETLPTIIALEKAMTPAEALGRVEAKAALDAQVNGTLATLKAAEVADKALAGGDLATALAYFELIEHSAQVHARWSGKWEEYTRTSPNPVVNTILALPSRIIDQNGGPAILEANLQTMGPIAQMARLPILIALSNYYMLQGRPDMVVKFTTLSLPQLRLGENDQPAVWDVQLSCELAGALLMQNDVATAAQRIGPCLRSATKLGNPDFLAKAHLTNILILEAAGGRQEEAQESAAYVAQHPSDDPTLLAALAQLRTQQGRAQEAAEAWRKACRLYEAQGNVNRAAWAHLWLAASLSLATKESTDEEREHLETAVALFRKLGDAGGQGMANAHLGRYFARKGDSSHALELFETSLKFLRQAKNQSFEAFVLSEIGHACRDNHNAARALEMFRQAAGLYDSLGDLSGEAFQISYQAWALEDLQKFDEALSAGLRAERIADRSGAWRPRHWTRRYLSTLYTHRGEFENAIVALREARAISISAGQPVSGAQAALELASDLITVGEREEALDALNLSLPVFRQSHDSESEAAAYLQLIEIYGGRESDFKDFDKALQYYQAARQLIEKNAPERVVSLNLDLVEIYWQQKKYTEAAALAREGLEYYQRNKCEPGEVRALLALAEVQRLQDDLKGSAASLVRAEPLVKRVDDAYLTGAYHYRVAGLRQKEGHFQRAIDEYEQVIALLEQFKSTADPGLRSKVANNYGYIYDELIDTLYQLSTQNPQSRLSFASHALEQTELNKSRVFTTAWGRTFLDGLRRKLPAALQERERSLGARQAELQTELQRSMAGEKGRPAKQVQEDMKRLDNELTALRKDLRQASPAYAEARYPARVSIPDLPLRDGETFIEFKMLEDSLLVWMITGQSAGPPQLAAFYKVDHPRTWFEERILEIRSAFNRGFPDQFDPQVSEELFNALFPAPYAQLVTSAQAVIFVPDDILFLLPFEMLSPQASHSQFVLLKTPTSYFPSAAALRLSRAIVPEKREWPAQFFALADPITTTDDERYGTASIISEVEALGTQSAAVAAATGATLQPVSNAPQPSGDTSASAETDPQPAVRGLPPIAVLKSRGYYFERLPETATEAKNIAALFPAGGSGAVVRTGTDATKRELLQTDLGRFRFIHFATHGFLPVEPGVREPALVLSYDGKAEDKMMLTMSEVVQLKLQTDMVVLSACNTGSGRVTRAEGVSSLGTSFLAAGASSVTVSLWQVADKSTAILMQEYYRNLQGGMTKNKALAAARAALVAKGYANPFFWAPFVLTGE